MKPNLHIFVPGQLKANSGGIETWLDYFSKGILNNGHYETIYVYGFYVYEDRLKIYEQNKNKNIKFFLSHLSKTRKGALNILKFTRTHKKNFKKHVKEKDHMILVGSVTIVPFFISVKKIVIDNQVKTITWIRSKTLGEMKSRKYKSSITGKLLEENIINNTDVIITNGEDTLNYYRKLYPKQKEKMSVVPNAVNYEEYSKIKINDISTKENFNIAYTGRYVTAKGFDNFIESINVYFNDHQKDKNMEFNSFGSGDLENKIPNSQLNNMGPYTHKELYKILSENDIFVFLNKSDNAGGLSHALLEVMAAGKIIIAWDNPVHAQVLSEENSILLAEGDTKGLSDTYKILEKELIINQDKYIRMRENARKIASNYSVETHIKRYIQVID